MRQKSNDFSYLCLSLPPVVCRRAHVLFMLFVFVFTSSSCLQEGTCHIYVICVCLPVVCRRDTCNIFVFVFTSSCLQRAHVLFMLFVFVFTSSCLQEGSCLIYVICVCLYLQLFVGGLMSYLCYLCLSLPPVVCRRAHVLFMLFVFVFTSSCLQEGSCLIYVICVCLYLQLFVGGLMSYLCYLCLSLPPVVCRRAHVLFMLFVFVFTSSCLQEGSCLIYVICVCLYLQLFVGGLMSYLCYLCLSLPPVVCRRAHVLFMLFVFVFTSSCLQEGSCLIYVICVCLYLQLFVGGLMSYLCYLCLSLPPVVCRRAHVLFMLFVFVFTSSCLQEGSCLIYVICVCLYLQLFVGGLMSYLCYLCLSLPPVVCRRAHVLFMLFVFVFTSSCLQEGSCLIYVICVCLYLQLFVGGLMSYLCYLCLSLPPVVCRRAHVLFMLFVFVFTSSCLQEGSCLIYVICVCLYLQLFVGGLMSYLCYLCLSLPPVVCRRAHVLFMLFVFVFTSSCLQEGSCLIYVICVCLYLQLFVGGLMSYLCYLCLSLPPVVCRRAHVLFMLFVFVFTSSCLQEGSCLIYVICVCLYLQLFVGGLMSYLCYLCLSLPPVVCRRAHVLFMLFVFVFTSSCLQEGSCLIYVICVCLYLQLFVGGLMSYLCYLCLSLPPVVCRRAHVLFMLFVFVFTSSCLQEGSCLIYVICVCLYLQLFVGGLMSYLCYLCLSLPPVVCRRAHVLFMLFVFVFTSSCLQEGSCLIYVICVCLYLQLFVGGLMSYLCYLCLSLPPVVCRRAHVLFMLFVFVFTSSCLQEGSCLIYVICVCLYLQLFVGGLMSYLCYLCLSLPPVVCRRAHVLFMLFVFVFTSSCLQEGSCLIYVICVCLYLQLFVGGLMSYLCYLCLSLPPVVCRRAHVLFMLFVFVFTSSCLQEGSCLIYVICVCLYLQLFVGGLMSYLCYLCLSLPPVVCRRAHVLFMLFVFVFTSSCLQEGSCLIYVICVCLYLQLFVGGLMSYLCYLCLSLPPVVCRRAHVLFMLFVFVFTSSCLQEGSCLIYVICVCLYLQLFVGGLMSYLCYLCLSLPPVVCRRAHVLFMLFVFVFTSSCLQEGSCLIYVICVCLYLQLFVGGLMSYLCYLCLSLPPVVCRRAHVLFMLFVFVFTSSCLQEGSCLIYVICVCLYLQLFVGGLMSYLCYLCLSLPPVVCRRAHVLFMLFVFVVCRRAHVLFMLFVFVFTSSCLQEGSCLIYVICVCLYLQLFVGGLMSYLCYLCLSLPPVVCRRAHVLFMLFVFVFTSSCLQEGSCLIYVICVCLYLQLFVGGLMSYLCYLCLSLPPVVCRRAHVLFMLFVFVFTSSCLQEGSCLIYVICVCLYLQLFVGGLMSYLCYLCLSLPPVVCRRAVMLFVFVFTYLCYLCLSLPPVVCRRAHVLFMLFVFVFTSSCLQEGSCLIYVICVCLYLQLFVGGLMSYLCYLCLSLPPVVCRRAHVLFMLFVFVFTSSCLQEGSCLIYVICVCLYLQLFVGGLMSYLCYLCLSLPPVVCRRAHVLFMLFVFVFTSSCLQEGSCLIYVICVCLYLQLFVGGLMSYLCYLCLSLPPVVCRRAHVLFMLFVFVFTSSCLQEGSCLIYVICVCLYLQLFVGGLMSYLCYLCLSLPPVVCRRAHVLFMLFVFVFTSSCLQEGSCLIYVICVCLYLQLFVGGLMSYLCYLCLSLPPVVCRRAHVLFMLFVFVFTSSCLQEGSCLIYVICVCLYLQLFVGGLMSYLCYLCLSLPPVVCRRAHVLFMLFVFVFTSSCLQEGSCLIYVICVCLYLQLFVGGLMSYLCYLCLSLPPVVCRRAHVLFMLFVFVFTSSCLQEGSCLIYVICVCLYLQLFVGGLMSYLCYLCLSLPPVVCRRAHVLFMLFVFVFTSSCLQEGSCLIYVICVCLYLQLFVGGLMSYLCYLCLSLPPVVCRRAHVLFMLFVFVFTSSCLQEGSCLIYVICVCLYLQLFVGGLMSYLCYLCLSLPPVVCRRAHVLFMLFVFVFTSSCLQEGSCLIYVICVCLYLQLFVGGLMSYLCYLCLSLPPVVCRRAHVLFMLFVFVFTSSCLQEGSCLIYVICVCLYLQLFVGGLMSYLCYLCLSLPPVVCRRAHVLFMLFVFVFTSSCLQEGSCLIYVICVCLYLQLFVGGLMSYLCYLCLSLPPVVCRRAHVLFMLFVFVFTSSCLQEGSCLIYVICVCLYLQLFVGGLMSYLCYLCLSLPPVVCRRAHVLFMLFVFVFTSSCLQEGSCLIYVICVCLYLQLFVGGLMSYLCYLCLSLPPVVCRRAHVLFMLFVFVFTSSCLQEGSCLIYVICVCLYLQLFVGGLMSYLCYLCLSLPPVVCRRAHVLFMLFVFVFTSSCLQEGSCLIYVICVCLYLQLFVGGLMSYLCYLCLSLPPVVCRRAHVLFMLFVFVFTSSCLQEGSCLIYVICVCLYLQLFVGGLMSYLCYLCLSLPPVVCRRAHVLFMLFVFVFTSSCLQEGSCLIYVICVCLYLQLFVGGLMSYLCYLCLSLPPVVCRRAHVLFMLFVFVFTSSCLQEGSCLIYVICVCLYLQLFVGGLMSYLCYLCLSLPPVVCRRAHVLFMLFVFVFTSSCLQEGSCLIYVICVCLYLQLFVGGLMSYLCYLCLSLPPVVCRRAHVLFMLFVFVFTSSCLQEGSCLIYVICVCLYLQLFVGGLMSYLCYLCLSLPPVVCRRAHVLFMLFVFVFTSSCLQEGSCLIYVICVCLYLQLFVGGLMSYLCYLCLSLPPVVCRRAHVLFMLFVFVFTSSCLQEGSCLIYVICVCLYLQLFVGGLMSYLCYLCLSLPPVVCRRAHVLFMLFVFVFTSSCLQEGSCLIYVICVCLYLQLFVGGLMSYLCYLCLSLPPVVCRRAHVLFMLFVFVFTSSCLQEGSCLIYVICVCLYLQLFVGGLMSYLCYLCLSLPPVVCRRAHVLFMLFVFVFTSSCLQEGSCLIYVICVCLYLQLFVGGLMSYLCYLCLSLPPVVCRRAHVLFMLFVFVFTSSCLQEGSCLIYVICVQLFVGGHMSYLCYLCLSLPPVVCRRAHVLFMLFVFVFTSSCLQEGSCLIYVICVCLYLQLFVGGLMSYLCYLCLSLPPVVCRRAHVLFMLFVFVFTSSCLQEGSCLIYVICVCLYLQLFVGGLMSYLCYLCLSLPPVVCRRAHVLFMLFVFVFTSSCLQEGSCLIYVICVCLYLQLFVGGLMSYLCYLCLSLPPVVCRRAHVLFMLFVFVFTSSCLQEGSCLIYVICVCLYLQLFVGGLMSYLCYLCLSLPPVVCRRAHVLFMLFVFVFTSSCLQEGTCLIYVICVCLYLQLFVGGLMSYLCYLCLSLPPVVCRRAHVLFMLFVFVFTSSCLQEGSCLIYVICVCLYLQLFVGGLMSYLCYLCLSLPPVVCRRAHVLFMLFVFVFTSSCLQEGSCLIYVICVCLYLQLFVGGLMSYLCYLCLSLPPVVCRRAHVLFMLFVFVFTSSCLQEGSCLIYVICVCLYLQLFVGGLMSYLCYLCLSLPPVVCRRAHVLFMLFVFVFTSSCLQEGSCLIYVICVCLYLQLFVGGLMSYLCYLCLSLPPVVCRRDTCLIYVICVCLYLQLFVGGLMSYLCYLCLSLPPVVCRRDMSYLCYLCLSSQITLIRHEPSYKQLEVKTNTNNVNKA